MSKILHNKPLNAELNANHNSSNALKQTDSYDEDIIFDVAKFNDSPDPKTSERIYNIMNKTLDDIILADKKKSDIRKKIEIEKNIFLNNSVMETEITDSKLTIMDFLKILFDGLNEAVKSGQDARAIFDRFWKLNEERGFHKQPSIIQSNSFNLQLKGLLSVPPPRKKNK